MKHRKLRIVWSVAWGIAAVLLVALWVRVIRRECVQYMDHRHAMGVWSVLGQVTPYYEYDDTGVFEAPAGWIVGSEPIDPVLDEAVAANPPSRQIPYWLIVVLSATLAAATSLRWRYSLRTLLIATTLVAVGLGLIVWAAR